MKKKGTKQIKTGQLRIAPELMQIQQLMPIEKGDYDNLKADITENGIRDPLKAYYKDKFYYVIAGLNRLKIAKEAGITILPVDIYDGKPEEFNELAIKDNLNRRHLNTAQKRKIAEYFIKLDPTASARAIAEKSGITDKTAGRIKTKLQSGAEIPHLDKVKGADGKTYRKPEKGRVEPNKAGSTGLRPISLNKAHHNVINSFYRSMPEGELTLYQLADITEAVMLEITDRLKNKAGTDYILKGIQKTIKEARIMKKTLVEYKKDHE